MVIKPKWQWRTTIKQQGKLSQTTKLVIVFWFLSISSFSPGIPFLPTKRCKGGEKKTRGFECHENSGFPLSVCFLLASCLACHKLGELCFAFFGPPKLLPPHVFSVGLSKCPYCLSFVPRREWGADCSGTGGGCLFKLFIWLSSAVAPSSLNALLSSFRERVLTVLPTRYHLPLPPYGIM